jgi:hypothetical protein
MTRQKDATKIFKLRVLKAIHSTVKYLHEIDTIN